MARTKAYERQTVIQQAFAIFIARGYQSTSLSDLTSATGLNKKSLYNEFGNKESLFMVVLEDFIANERAQSGPLLREKPLGIDNIQAFFGYLFTHFSDSGCLLTLSLNESECIPSISLALIDKTLLAVEKAFYLNLLAEPAFDDAQAQVLARNFLALMQGYTSLCRSTTLREHNQQHVNQFLDLVKAMAK